MGQPASMAKITRTPPLETIDELGTLIADVQARRVATGGDPLDVCFAPFGRHDDVASWIEELRQDLPAYEDAGRDVADHRTLRRRSFDELRDAVARVADEVVARTVLRPCRTPGVNERGAFDARPHPLT